MSSVEGNCCQCDNALSAGGHKHCQIAARRALESMASELRERRAERDAVVTSIVAWHRRRADGHKAKAIELCAAYHAGERSRDAERSFEAGVRRNSLATTHYAAADAIERGEYQTREETTMSSASTTPEPFRDRLVAFLAAQSDISFPVGIYDDIDLGRFVARMLKFDAETREETGASDE